MTPDAPTPAQEDPDLVARARSGDERAMGALVDRHHGSVFRTALAIVRDEDLAADAAQDAFLKAFRGLDGFRGDAAFRTWLLAIAANEARTLLRRVGRRRETALDDVGPLQAPEMSPAEAAILHVEAARVRRSLAALPEKQRLAVTLRLEEGLSFREVGEVIGSSEGAARVNYFHGVRRLREMLE